MIKSVFRSSLHFIARFLFVIEVRILQKNANIISINVVEINLSLIHYLIQISYLLHLPLSL